MSPKVAGSLASARRENVQPFGYQSASGGFAHGPPHPPFRGVIIPKIDRGWLGLPSFEVGRWSDGGGGASSIPAGNLTVEFSDRQQGKTERRDPLV